jgi:hypothetical protein
MAIMPSAEEMRRKKEYAEKQNRKSIGNPEYITKWVEGVKGEPKYDRIFKQKWMQMTDEQKIEFLKKQNASAKASIKRLSEGEPLY